MVCQGLLIIEIVICINYLIVSSTHAVRPTTSPFHLSVNMHVFDVKSYIECHKDKKGIKKAVTGLVSVHVGKTLVGSVVARWSWDEETCRRHLVDE